MKIINNIKYYTVKEASQLLKVSIQTVYTWIKYNCISYLSYQEPEAKEHPYISEIEIERLLNKRIKR